MHVKYKGLNNLVAILKNLLADNNKSLAKSAIVFVGKFGTALGPGLKVHSKVLVPELIKNLSDKQAAVRQETLNSIDKFQTELGNTTIINSMLPLLTLESPEIRTEVVSWLLKNKDSLGKADLKQNVIPILSVLQDKSKDIRLLAEKLLGVLISIVGTGPYINGLKDMKPAIQYALAATIEKYSGENEMEMESVGANVEAVPKLEKMPSEAILSQQQVQNLPLQKPMDAALQLNKPVSSVTKVIKSNISADSTPKKTAEQNHGTGTASHKNEKLSSIMPAQALSDMKPGTCFRTLNQKTERNEEEKETSWLTDDLDDELVDRLKSQLKINIAPTLYSQMFSVDTKKNIEALKLLKKALMMEYLGTVDCLYLIIRWLFFRLWDNSNPALVKESLDYIQSLVSSLGAGNYTLLDFEASVLIACLISKLGQQTTGVQSTLYIIFENLCNIYAPNKIALYLLHGMNSNSLVIRAECITVLSKLITICGADILTPRDVKIFGKLLGHTNNEISSRASKLIFEVSKHVGQNVLTLIEADAPAKVIKELREKLQLHASQKYRSPNIDVKMSVFAESVEAKTPLYDPTSPAKVNEVVGVEKSKVYEQKSDPKKLEIRIEDRQEEVEVEQVRLF